MRLFYLIALSLCSTSLAAAQAHPPGDSGPTIVTKGAGEVTLPPDRAILRFTAASRATTPELATQQNASRLRHLIDSLDSLRRPGDSLELLGVTLAPQENYERGEITGYEAAADVRMTIRDMRCIAAVLNAGLSAGATGVAPVGYRSDRHESARREALARAFAQARADADALAQAGGFSLGPLQHVSTAEGGAAGGFGGAWEVRVEEIMVQSPSAVAPQNVTVRATVTTTWRLEVLNKP